MKNSAKKEHKEHQKAIKPLLAHFHKDEMELKKNKKKKKKK